MPYCTNGLEESFQNLFSLLLFNYLIKSRTIESCWSYQGQSPFPTFSRSLGVYEAFNMSMKRRHSSCFFCFFLSLFLSLKEKSTKPSTELFPSRLHFRNPLGPQRLLSVLRIVFFFFSATTGVKVQARRDPLQGEYTHHIQQKT